MIEVSNVSHCFGACDVLKDVSLSICERRVGIIGANGSGKSTFARLLNGLLIPDKGTVRVDGIDTREDVKAVRRRVGFVFQNPDNQIVFPVVEERCRVRSEEPEAAEGGDRTQGRRGAREISARSPAQPPHPPALGGERSRCSRSRRCW